MIKDLKQLKEEMVKEKFDYSTTRRLLEIPQVMWDSDIVPILRKHKVRIVKEYNPTLHIDYKNFIRSLNYPSLKKVMFLSLNFANDALKMRALKWLLKKFGFRIIKVEGAYDFTYDEESIDKARTFLEYYTQHQSIPGEVTEVASVVKSEPIINEIK